MSGDRQHGRTPRWAYVALAVAALVIVGLVALTYQDNPLNGFIMVAGLVLFGVPAISIIIAALQGDSHE